MLHKMAETIEGAMIAVVAKGAQDVFMEGHDDTFDVRSKLLNGVYQMVYGKFDTLTTQTIHEKDGTLVTSFDIEQGQWDLINMVDLVVFNPKQLKSGDYIKRIFVEIGGQRIDYMTCGDIDTMINTNCVLFDRKMSHIHDKTFIPLVVAPFHQNNLIRIRNMQHGIRIVVELKQDMEMELYGRKYITNVTSKSENFITVQNQYTGCEKLRKGVNTFRLNFNHPMFLIYFWGFDKTKVKNITLRLQRAGDFYNGPIEALEHFKYNHMGHDVDPVVMYFAHTGYFQPTKCSVNFSRLDYIDLIIETDEEEERDVYIIGHNMQVMQCASGMYGMRFSK